MSSYNNNHNAIQITQNSNVPILDSLRAFAALSVCMFHFVCGGRGYIQSRPVIEAFLIGKHGVQLFFVISGFVIPWSMYHANFKLRHFFKFALKRLSRLEPPYLFSLVMTIILLWSKDHFLHLTPFENVVNTPKVLLHFGYLIPFSKNQEWLSPVYWTLAIEFQFYFFIALLFIPIVNSKLIARIVVLIAIISISYIGNGSFLPYWLPIFYIGISLFMYMVKKSSKFEFGATMMVLFIFFLYKYTVSSVFFVLTPVIAILFFPRKKIPALDFLGKISYSLYLIHPIFGLTFIVALSQYSKYAFQKIAVIAGAFIITLLFSYLMYILVEKPSKKLSSLIKYK